jgi:hypothetical protein
MYYLVKQINEGAMVVNPIYSKLTQTIEKNKTRESPIIQKYHKDQRRHTAGLPAKNINGQTVHPINPRK